MATYNQGDGLKLVAQLDVPKTTDIFKQQLEEIAQKLTLTITNVKIDSQAFAEITSSIKNVQAQVDKLNEIKINPFNTSAMSQVPDITLKAINAIKDQYRGLGDIISTALNFNSETKSVESFTMQIKNAIGEMQNLKFEAEGARIELNNMGQMAVTGFKQVPMQTITDTTEKVNLQNQTQLLKDWTSAQDKYFAQLQSDAIKTNNVIDSEAKSIETSISAVNQKIYSLYDALDSINANGKESLQSTLAGLVDTGDSTGVANIQKKIAALKELSSAQSQANVMNQKYDEQQAKADYSAYENAINQKIKLIETFNDLNITSNEETFTQLKQLYTENSQYFAQNIDKNIAMLQKLNDAEIAANAPEKSMSSGSGIANRNQPLNRQYMNTSGFGMTPLNMGITLAQIQLEATLIENIKNGFVTLQQGSAGLQQVFGDTIKNQSQLNDVTNQFVAVAQKYGASVDDVVTSAKLWGRQYKDVETALTLTNNATLLSIVDNLSVADSNKAVESSMNAMGESVSNAGQAYNASIKLVDSWSAVSHAASVSAQDLTQGFERSAAAAHNAGITVDELNSLIASGVRATGRSGSIVGNMYKSVFANIETESPKVMAAFKALGIQVTDSNGKLLPVYNTLVQLSEALKTATPDMQKYFEAIAGGKYQFDTLEAALSNTSTLQNAYTASVQSAGKANELAQAQLHTLHAQLTRLQNAIQALAFNAGNTNGVGTALSGMVSGLTNFLQGLAALPPSVTVVTVSLAALLLGINRIKAVMDTFSGMGSWFSKFVNGWKGKTDAIESDTVALARNSLALDQVNATIQSYLDKQAMATRAIEADTIATQANTESKIANADATKVQSSSDATLATVGIGSDITQAGESAASGVAQKMTLLQRMKGALSAVGIGGAAVGAEAALAPETMGISLIPLAIPASIAGITALIAHYGALKQAQQEQAQTEAQTSEVYAQNAKQIDQLSQKYEQLSQATKNGTQFADAKQQQDYYNTMTQLAQLMPNVVAYTDKNGQAHLVNANILQKEIDLQRQLNQEQAQSNDNGGNKALNDYYNKLGSDKSAWQTAQSNAGPQTITIGRGFDTGSQTEQVVQSKQQELQLTQQEIQAQQTYEEQLSQINTIIQQTAQTAIDAKTKLSATNTTIFQSLIGSVDPQQTANLSKDAIQKLSDAFASLMTNMQQEESQGKSTWQAWTDSLQKAESTLSNFPDAKQIFEDTTSSVDAMRLAIDDLQGQYANAKQSVDDMSNSLSDVNHIIDEYNNKQSISASEIQKVIKNHQALADAFTVVDGKYQVNIKAVEDYRNAQVASEQDIIKAIQAGVIAQEKALESKLSMYNLDIQGMQSVAQAANEINQINSAQANASGGILTSGGARITGGGSNTGSSPQISSTDAANIGNLVALSNNLKSLLSSAPSTIMSSGALSVPKSGSTSTKGSSNPYTNYMDQNQDPYTTQLNIINSNIQKSQTIMATYDQTSQQYRDELSKQIDLLHQKQKVTNSDISWTEKQITSLERLKNATSNLSQRKSIQSQIDTYQQDIAKEQGDLATIAADITNDNNAIDDSKLQEWLSQVATQADASTTQINNLSMAISLLGNSDANSQARIGLQGNLLQAYQDRYSFDQQVVSGLQQMSGELNHNSQAWKDNQSALKQYQSDAQSTIKSIQQLGQSLQSDITSRLEQLKTDELNAIQQQQQSMTTNLANMQKQPTDYGTTAWNEQLQSINETLNEIDGNFNTMPLFNDNTGNVRATLEGYNSQIQQLASNAQQLGNQDPQDINALYSNLQQEITFANSLQQQIKSVNDQEAQLQIQITETTDNYANQITILQNKLNLLNQQYTTESNLKQLQQDQLQLQQALEEKNSQYIDSQGNLTWTYNAANVDKLQQQEDQMAQSIRQGDVKQALQDQINALTKQKDEQTKILQEQLAAIQQYQKGLTDILNGVNTDVKNKQSELSNLFNTETTNVTNAWKSIEDAVANGTTNVSDILSGKDGTGGWYAETIGNMAQFGINVGTQVQSIISELGQLSSVNSMLSSAESSLVSGMSGGSTSTPTSSSGSSKTITMDNKYGKPTTGTNYNDIVNKNGGQWLNHQWVNGHYINGKWTPETHHDGGIVGQGVNTTPSGISSLVNKLFNVQPNEQVIKALVGEVMVPPSNIIKNFIPNMQHLASQLMGNGGTVNSKTYVLQNPTIVANDPVGLFNGIDYLVNSQ